MRRDLEAARRRFTVLSQSSRSATTKDHELSQALQEIYKIWDELRAAQQELEQQNNEVAGAYETLESERHRYRDLFDLAPDPYLVTSWRGIILEANRAAARLLNMRQDFLLGKPLGVFVAKESRREFISRLVGLRENGELSNWELRLQPPERPAIPVSITVAVSSLVTKDSVVRKLEMLWLLRDLTQQLEAEANLRESEERYRSLFENAIEGICRVTPEGRFITVNPALAAMLGHESPEELLSLRAQDLYVDPAERARLLEEVEASPEKSIRAREVLLKKRDGRHLWASLSVRGIPDQRGRTHVYESMTQNITERKIAEERLRQREHLATVGATVAVLAHEISNPLTGMYSNIQLMGQYLANHDYKDALLAECVSNLEVETRRLANLLNDFRLFSQQQYKFETIVLNEIIDEVVKTQTPSYAQMGIRVELKIPEDLPRTIGDRNKLKQALLNLCKNAVEAMPAGGTLTICGTRVSKGVSVEIKDTGNGVPAGRDVFEAFVTTKEHGTGLGLAIVRQVAQAHGGKVTYISEPGKGTTFRLFLPLRSVPANRKVKQPSPV